MRILVCRPQKDSASLATKLKQKGYYVASIPTINILYKKISITFEDYTSLVFTSKYAVKSLFKQYSPNLFKNKKIYCVGETTANYLMNYGFCVSYPSVHGSKELLKIITQENIAKDKFAIISGVAGNDLLFQELSKITVCDKVESYVRDFEDVDTIYQSYQYFFTDKQPNIIVTSSIDVFRSLNRIFEKTTKPSNAIVTITSAKMLEFVNEHGFNNVLKLEKLDNNYIYKKILEFTEAKNVGRKKNSPE